MKIKREDLSFKKIVLTFETTEEADEFWLRFSIRPSMIDAAKESVTKMKSNEDVSMKMFEDFNQIYQHSKFEERKISKTLKHSRV